MIELLRRFGGKFRRYMVIGPACKLIEVIFDLLTPLVIAQIFEIIQAIRSEGVTVFLVEQNANKALHIADRGYVLENGHVVLEDTGANLLTNPEVRKAYLGA